MNLKRLLLLLTSHFLLFNAAAVRADVWTSTAIPPKSVGGGRTGHTAVWTGKYMIVWGGAFGSNGIGHGGVYDPVSDTWRPTSIQNLPSIYLGGHSAVWAGEPVNRMLVYGGNFPPFGGDGGMYDPESDQWTKIEIDGDRRANPPIQPPPNVPRFRINHTAVWTGREMIVWAGRGGGGLYGYAGPTGGAYRPTCGAYIYEPEENARVNREVTFRLHVSPSGAPRRAQLVIDGEPYGDWQRIEPDSRVRFPLSDELRGPYKFQVKTAGAGGEECLSSQVSVFVGVTVKVLRLIFDPKFEQKGGITFRQLFNYLDPNQLSPDYVRTLAETSGWFANYVYEPARDVTFDGYAEQVNGHVMNDDEYFNRLTHGGWANLAGFVAGESNSGEVGLGNSPDTMSYAQSFKVWGAGLKGVRLKLRKVGTPTQPVKVSVRRVLDGPDLCVGEGAQRWCGAQISPGAAPVVNDSDYFEAVSNDYELSLENNATYYLVVRFGDPSAAPDPNNHYKLKVVGTPGPNRGQPSHTDPEALLFQGSQTRHEELDMEVKLSFTDRVDYKKLLEETVLPGRSRPIAEDVRDGLVDEVWAFGGPIIGMWEAAMMGPGAFNVNGEPWPDINSGRSFIVMGFSYERDVALMLHNYGHRTERTMTHVYGGWNNWAYGRPAPTPLPVVTNWDRFTAFRGVLYPRDVTGCGAVHYAPNATDPKAYSYDVPGSVRSTCDDWLNYPNFKRVTRVITPAAWGRTQLGFLRWWFTRMPKARGRNADGKLNNWWRYVVETDYYK